MQRMQSSRMLSQRLTEVVFSEHRCLYGIVESVDGLELGCRDITLSKDQSSLVVCDRDKHVFFLTKKYDKQYGYGERSRQYPKEEAEKYAEALLDFGVMPN